MLFSRAVLGAALVLLVAAALMLVLIERHVPPPANATHVVVARYKEDIEWLAPVTQWATRVFIYEKGVSIAARGSP